MMMMMLMMMMVLIVWVCASLMPCFPGSVMFCTGVVIVERGGSVAQLNFWREENCQKISVRKFGFVSAKFWTEMLQFGGIWG